MIKGDILMHEDAIQTSDCDGAVLANGQLGWRYHTRQKTLQSRRFVIDDTRDNIQRKFKF